MHVRMFINSCSLYMNNRLTMSNIPGRPITLLTKRTEISNNFILEKMKCEVRLMIDCDVAQKKNKNKAGKDCHVAKL